MYRIHVRKPKATQKPSRYSRISLRHVTILTPAKPVFEGVLKLLSNAWVLSQLVHF